MSIRRDCPCDLDDICHYDSEINDSCEYWCGADEPWTNPAKWEFGFLILSNEEVEPAPSNEILGWDG